MCWETDPCEPRNDFRKNLSEIFFSTETSHMAELADTSQFYQS